jgi:hypothetical protein
LIPASLLAALSTMAFAAKRALERQNDYDVQIAKRDLGTTLDRIETANKPKAA